MEAGAWVFVSALILALLAPAVAYRLKIAEFRQAWINELRKDIADYVGVCRKWVGAYDRYSQLEPSDETRPDIFKNELFPIATDAFVLFFRIKMRINPLESETKKDDDELLAALASLTDPGQFPPVNSISDIEPAWRRL